jgi:hypothetical protein
MGGEHVTIKAFVIAILDTEALTASLAMLAIMLHLPNV